MFGFFSKKITELSNHSIDFSRVGELAKANHHYSREEIIARTKIVTSAAVLGISGSYLNNKNKTNCSNLTMGLLLGTVGLLLSHSIVILPLVKKRRKMSKICDELIIEINSRINYLIKNHFVDLSIKEKVKSMIDQIRKVSLSDEKHGRASQTWGRRITLLSRVRDSLDFDPLEIENIWSEEMDGLMLKFYNDDLFIKKNFEEFSNNALKK